MKKKYSRILGVALALMLLASLFGFAVPVSAQVNPGAWTPLLLPAPGAPGNYVYNPTATPFTAAQFITKGIDGALYCHNNDGSAATSNLYKSTDDGRSWSRVAVNLVNIVLVDIVCSSTDANIVYVASATTVYVSINGGLTFTAMAPNAAWTGTHVISSIDVGYLATAAYVFVATRDTAANTFGGVYVLGPAYGAGWTDLLVGNQAAQGVSDAVTVTSFAADTVTISAAARTALTVIPVAPATYNATTGVITFTAGAETCTIRAKRGTTAFTLTSTGAVAHTTAVVAPDDGDSTIVSPLTGGADAFVLPDGGLDAYKVKTATDFGTSQTIIVAVSNEVATWTTTKYSGANWAATVADTAIVNSPPVTVEIALPGNFSSVTTSGMMEYFVGVDTGAAGTGDVFRIILGNTFDRNIGGPGTATDVTGLDIAGDIGTASLMAGRADLLGLGTRSSANYGASWTLSAKSPVGTAATIATWVVMADDFATSGKAWGATSGVDSGVYLTVNSGASWNGVGLLNTDLTLGGGAAIQDIAVGVDSAGTEIVFVAIMVAGGQENLWRHDGTNWEQIWADGLGFDVDLVAVTDTFATDGTVFFADNTLLKICRSLDQGGIWVPQLSSVPGAFGATTSSWLILDENTMLVGTSAATGLIYRTANNGTTWAPIPCGIANAIASLAKSPEYATDSTIAAGTVGGFVVLSVTGGLSYTQIPAGALALTGAGNTFVAFNQQDATVVYAVAAGAGSVWRFTLGAAAWLPINQGVPVWITPTPVANPASTVVAAASTGIASAADGTLYLSDVTAGVGALRTIYPMNPAVPAAASPWWEPISGLFPGASITAGKIVITPGKVWVYDNTAAVQLLFFEDSTTVAPTLGVPADGAAIDTATGTMLTWDWVPGGLVYLVQYNRVDLGWVGSTRVSVAGGVATNIAAGVLVPGVTYQWRVCVDARFPALGPWSEVREFTTAMGAGQWSPGTVPAGIGPAPGATDQPLKPGFQWNPSVVGTTGYEFELSTSSATDADGFFTSTVVSKIGASALTATAYTSDVALQYSTTYVWHVRAISASGQSAWFTGTFTTMAEPVEPTSPVVIQEVPDITVEAPDITVEEVTPVPSWALYVIIIIGAVLVIFVIVLIMRTRRPV